MKISSGFAIIIALSFAIAGFFTITQPAAEDAPSAADLRKQRTMQLVRGARAWKENCGRCHNLRSPRELTDEEWDVSVMHMRVRANLSAQEARDISEFLKASND